MTRNKFTRVWGWTIFCIVVLAVLFAMTSFLSAEPNVNFASTAVALSVIGAIAVGIERVIEAFWSFMGVMGKNHWPLDSVVSSSDKLVTQLDGVLLPYYEKVEKAIETAKTTATKIPDDIAKASTELEQLKATLEYWKTTIFSDPKYQEISVKVLKSTSALQEIFPELTDTTIVTNKAIQTAQEFVDSFRENPGRRLISIYVGMLLGLVAAWFAGLDVFQAVLETSKQVVVSSSPHWGIALTGLLMGLGASPTHEVIQILKEIKESRQAK
jgi:hypothetical protein